MISSPPGFTTRKSSLINSAGSTICSITSDAMIVLMELSGKGSLSEFATTAECLSEGTRLSAFTVLICEISRDITGLPLFVKCLATHAEPQPTSRIGELSLGVLLRMYSRTRLSSCSVAPVRSSK